MGLLKIKSENKDLSYVLAHNPSNPLICKTYKKGFMYSFYSQKDPQEYFVYFVDNIAPLKNDKDKYLKTMSFKPHVNSQYEYLLNNEFADARFIDAAITENFRTAIKGSEYDYVCQNEIVVFSVETSARTMSLFSKSFKDIEITYVTTYNKFHKVTFKGNCTLQYLLKIVNVFSLFASLEGNDTYLYFTPDLISKYLKMLCDIKAPYFIRYVFKVNMLNSKKDYLSLQELLLGNPSNETIWSYGDTHQQRINYVADKLTIFDKEKDGEEYLKDAISILDIGTGYDFRYLRKLGKLVEKAKVKYYAIERDEDAYSKINARIKNQGWTHVELFRTLEEFLESYDGELLNVVCSEVLEHNEIPEANELLKQVCTKINYKNAIFTIPNKDFNFHYFGDEDLKRHDDHKWEPTKQEFNSFVEQSLIGLDNYNIIYENVGDLVLHEGIYSSPTQSIFLTKK